MKYRFFLILLWVWTIVASQEAWTLERCLHRAMTHHPELNARRLAALSDSLRWQLSRADRWPRAEWTIGQGFQLGETFNVSTGVGQRKSSYTSYNLSIQTVVFEGLAKTRQMHYYDALRRKSRIEVSETAWQLQSEIITLFYQLLYDAESLDIQNELLQIQTQITRIAGKLYNEHLRPYDEYLSAQTDLAGLKRLREDLKKQYLVHQARLTELLHLDTSAIRLIPPADSIPRMLKRLPASEHLPQIRSAMAEIEAWEFRKKTEKSRRFPQLFLRYSYGSSYYHLLGEKDLIYNRETGRWEAFGPWEQFRSNQLHYVYAGLRIPLFEGFRLKRNVEIADLELRAARKRLQSRQRRLQSLFAQWTAEAESAYNQWKAQRKIVRLREENLRLYEQKYRNRTVPYEQWQRRREAYLQARMMLSRYKWETFMKYELLKRLFSDFNTQDFR